MGRPESVLEGPRQGLRNLEITRTHEAREAKEKVLESGEESQCDGHSVELEWEHPRPEGLGQYQKHQYPLASVPKTETQAFHYQVETRKYK